MSDETAFERFPGLTRVGGYQAVPCSTCRASQGEPCVQGGMAWPEPAHRPHATRRQAAALIGWWEDFGRTST